MRQLVIGAGEVGTALAKVLRCEARDVGPHTGHYDVLHIAFPWSRRFVATAHAYAELHSADLVVVHSTVPVGTCDPVGWVHSPVRGRHPDLVEGVESFVKHVGGARASEAAALFEAVGVEVLEHSLAATTEAGKLWELATYGIEIATQKRIKAWCEREGLDFEEVYTEFGSTYNDGWNRIGAPYLAKRLLRHEPGPIGGHCVVPGSRLLGEEWVNEILDPHS